MRLKALLTSLILIGSLTANAQIAGRSTYNFLNLNPSARVAALGGSSVSFDKDLNFAYYNPAVLHDRMDNQLILNFVNFFNDIKFGNAGYAKDFGKLGTFAAQVMYMNYGDFELTDPTGTKQGNFTAAEYNWQLSYGKQIIEKFHVGANLKLITSQLESYRSVGIATDLAGMYVDTANKFSASVLIRNVGTQLSTYTEGNKEPLPLDIQLGISKQLKYVPLRYNVVFHNLNRFMQLRYDDPNDEFYKERKLLSTGEEEIDTRKYVVDRIARHLTANAEFLFTQNFNIRLGYNHLRRAELGIPDRNGFSGFSFGFGFKVSKFQINYGNAGYSLVGSSHHFGILANLNDWKK